MSLVRRSFLAVALALSLFGLGAAPTAAQPQPQAQGLTVFAAASLKNVLDEAGAEYTRQGGVLVKFSYAASSALARQIEQGAPADAFVSADLAWMDYVSEKGLVAAGTRRNLLTNHLALIAPADAAVKLKVGKGMPIGQALGSGRLALAGPDVPAGKYGRAALASLGVWSQVEDKLVSAENVRAALLYVSRGEAPLGVVYDTDAKVDPKVKIVGLFPEGSHPKIVYPAAVLAQSKNPAAPKFLAWLQGPQGRKVFAKYGFTVLK